MSGEYRPRSSHPQHGTTLPLQPNGLHSPRPPAGPLPPATSRSQPRHTERMPSVARRPPSQMPPQVPPVSTMPQRQPSDRHSHDRRGLLHRRPRLPSSASWRPNDRSMPVCASPQSSYRPCSGRERPPEERVAESSSDARRSIERREGVTNEEARARTPPQPSLSVSVSCDDAHHPAWLRDSRRPQKDRERLPMSDEAFVFAEYAALIREQLSFCNERIYTLAAQRAIEVSRKKCTSTLPVIPKLARMTEEKNSAILTKNEHAKPAQAGKRRMHADDTELDALNGGIDLYFNGNLFPGRPPRAKRTRASSSSSSRRGEDSDEGSHGSSSSDADSRECVGSSPSSLRTAGKTDPSRVKPQSAARRRRVRPVSQVDSESSDADVDDLVVDCRSRVARSNGDEMEDVTDGKVVSSKRMGRAGSTVSVDSDEDDDEDDAGEEDAWVSRVEASHKRSPSSAADAQVTLKRPKAISPSTTAADDVQSSGGAPSSEHDVVRDAISADTSKQEAKDGEGRCVLAQKYQARDGTGSLSEESSGAEAQCARTLGYVKEDWRNRKANVVPEELENRMRQCFMEQAELDAGRSRRGNRQELRKFRQELMEVTHGNDGMTVGILNQRKKNLMFGKSRIHGMGLYAFEDIPAGDFIVEYVGEVVRRVVADVREKTYEKQGMGDSYLFRLTGNLVVDATRKGSIARFVNHSCDPSVLAKIITVNGVEKIAFYSKRFIKMGEEITYDYKFEFEEEDAKVACYCGAATCRKFLN